MMTREITITAADQRAVRREILRQSWILLAIFVLAVGLAAGLWAAQSSQLVTGPSWMPLNIATGAVVIPLFGYWVARRRTAQLLPLGSRHVLTVSMDTLDLVGPAGSSQHPWRMLSEPKRRSGVVTMRLQPTNVTLILPGGLVTGAAFLAIAERVRVAQAGGDDVGGDWSAR